MHVFVSKEDACAENYKSGRKHLLWQHLRNTISLADMTLPQEQEAKNLLLV